MIFAIKTAVDGPKFDRNAFHKLSHIRNAFAHGYLVADIRKDRTTGLLEPSDEYIVIETLNQDGSLKEVRRDIAVKEFTELYDQIVEFLVELGELVNSKSSG